MCRLVGVPKAVTRSAICLRDKFVHFTSVRIGSPAVWSSRTFKKFASTAALISIAFLHPPLFFGHESCPAHLSLPAPPFHGGSSLDRIQGSGQCTQFHHDPVWQPRWPRTAVDRPPKVTHTAASSSAQFPVHTRPCCPPWRFPTDSELDIILQGKREVNFGPFLSGSKLPLRCLCWVLFKTGFAQGMTSVENLSAPAYRKCI